MPSMVRSTAAELAGLQETLRSEPPARPGMKPPRDFEDGDRPRRRALEKLPGGANLDTALVGRVCWALVGVFVFVGVLGEGRAELAEDGWADIAGTGRRLPGRCPPIPRREGIAVSVPRRGSSGTV